MVSHLQKVAEDPAHARAEHTAEVKIRRAIHAPPVDPFARKGHEHVQVVPVVSRDYLPGSRRCRTHGLTTAAVISESLSTRAAVLSLACLDDRARWVELQGGSRGSHIYQMPCAKLGWANGGRIYIPIANGRRTRTPPRMAAMLLSHRPGRYARELGFRYSAEESSLRASGRLLR
jgi:hypothetical protein